MKVSVLTMTGGQYDFPQVEEVSYIENGNVFRVNWISRKRVKNKDFPIVNIEAIEVDKSQDEI